MREKALIIIAGPTSSGKSSIAVGLAERLNGEIVSADSMQVYRGMDIGTGKLSKDGMKGIPHHLIDVIEPTDDYNVSRFVEMAREAIDDILSRGKLPIVVGGTGFYIRSLLYTGDTGDPGKDPDYKNLLRERVNREGLSRLYEELSEIDPEAARRMDRNNRARIIRALEYNHATGLRYSEYCDSVELPEPKYRAKMFVLECERSVLYERMDERIDRMISDGLVEEVRGLISKGVDSDCTSMNGIGYKEIARYISGDIPLEEAVRLIKSNTHHYAVRQSTWFRHQKDTVIVDCRDREKASEEILIAVELCSVILGNSDRSFS